MKYEISLDNLIKGIFKSKGRFSSFRVRITEGDPRDNHSLMASLEELGVNYYFTDGASPRKEMDYEIDLSQIRIID